MPAASASATSAIGHSLASELAVSTQQVNAAITLLDEGATVPFISRYRKEKTGGLTDTQLRTLEARLTYLRELEQRRGSIRDAIAEAGQLDDALRARLDAATTKTELEDLYLPFRKKRKTRGVIATEAGLLPLAERLWSQPQLEPQSVATEYVDSSKGIEDSKQALDGARYILMERFAEDGELIAKLRDQLQQAGHLCATVIKGKETEGEKFRDYFEHQEPLSRVPGHRALAMFRGRSEGVLSLAVQLRNDSGEYNCDACIARIRQHTGAADSSTAAGRWHDDVVNHTWRYKLRTHLETDLFIALRERADTEAINVFSNNLRDLLLAAPAGEKAVLALDPGFRSGVKVAATDATSKLVAFTTVYPHPPQKQWQQARDELRELCTRHSIELIAVGNGTASRETDKLAAEVLADLKKRGHSAINKVTVSEAGASVYSASALAEAEFPKLDVTIRSAVSIARRLQDPLAELVKIEPKAIGVGQYQHDVSQSALSRSLEATVEDCVNHVGVDVNTASAALLERVAGISATLAGNIVEHRDSHGPFRDRAELLKVSRMGPRAFEQCAGFLRIRNGTNPLDESGVHPEAYPVVEAIVGAAAKPLGELIGKSDALAALKPEQFTTDTFGLPTVRDILLELEKPGRDPRPQFETAVFADDIASMADLQPNQVLEGQVTNVTNFGAFVDIGVHQDGLVHIASMSHKFIKDPREVVKTGDIIKVKVMSVDEARKRISLSMRLDDDANEDNVRKHTLRADRKPANPDKGAARGSNRSKSNHQASHTRPSALADALKASLDQSNSSTGKRRR